MLPPRSPPLAVLHGSTEGFAESFFETFVLFFSSLSCFFENQILLICQERAQIASLSSSRWRIGANVAYDADGGLRLPNRPGTEPAYTAPAAFTAGSGPVKPNAAS